MSCSNYPCDCPPGPRGPAGPKGDQGAVGVGAPIDDNLTSTATNRSLSSNMGRALANQITNHLSDTTDAHDASAVSTTAIPGIASGNVQDVLIEIVQQASAHVLDAVDAHDASAISTVAIASLNGGVASNVQDLLEELAVRPGAVERPVVQIPNRDFSGAGNFGQLTTQAVLITDPILVLNQTTAGQSVQLIQLNLPDRQTVRTINNGTTAVNINGFNLDVAQWMDWEYVPSQDNWFPERTPEAIIANNFGGAIAEATTNGGLVRTAGAFVRGQHILSDISVNRDLSVTENEQHSNYRLSQTTAGRTLGLIAGGYLGESKIFYNAGTVDVTVGSTVIVPGSWVEFLWNGASWSPGGSAVAPVTPTVVGDANLIIGVGAPANTLGVDGEYYQDVSVTSGNDTYGPKAAGVWPAASINLRPIRTAAQTPNTPAGNIVATNVQNAINELDVTVTDLQFDLATLNGVTLTDGHLGTFTGSLIPDSSSIKTALQVLETELESRDITGRYIGSAATFATLPTTSAATGAAVNGDWSVLTADVVGTGTALNPQFPRGVYLYNGAVYSFAFSLTANLGEGTEAELLAGLITVARSWTPQVLKNTNVTLDNRRWQNFGTGTLDLHTLHNGNGGDPYRLVSFGTAANLVNAPNGAATNTIGFAQYSGDNQNGFAYVTLLQDPLDRYIEAYASVTAGVYSAWQITSGTEWIFSASGDQLSSGIRMIVGNTHNITINAPSTNSSSDIRLVPATSWANVGTVTPAAGSSIAGTMPTFGTEEVVLVPNGTGWIVSRSAAVAPPVVCPEWLPNTVYRVGDMVHANIGGVIVTFMVITAHTSPVLFDVPAFLNLRYVGQHRITGSFPAGTAVPQGFKIRQLNVQWERSSNGTTGTAFDGTEMSAWVSQGNGGWRGLATNSRVETTDGRVYTTGTQTFFLRSNATRVTGATLDAAELSNWQLVGQSSTDAFVSGQLYPVRAQVSMNGSIWERNTAGSDTTWTPASWARLTAGSAILWTGNTMVQPDEKRFLFIGGPRCEFESTATVARITSTNFDATEAGNWRLMRQSFVPDYPANAGLGIMFPAGYQVTFNGVLYERVANGQGNVFNAGDWHRLTAPTSTIIPPWTANEISAIGDQRTRTILGSSVIIRSLANGANSATFDENEANFWALVSQEIVPQYTGVSTVFVAGFKVLFGGQTWQRNFTGTATTWVPGDWTQLSTGTTNTKLPWTRLVAGARGSTVTYGTIAMGVASTGNASMVARSSTGAAINARWVSWLSASNSSGSQTGSLAAATSTYMNSTYNYTQINEHQFTILEDLTNNRRYRIQMIVQSNHNDQIFMCEEL